VKEFLMSGRLAAAQLPTIRRYNILTTPAHTMVAKACLGTLLHPDETLTNDSLKKLPLARYAARHWVDHALFENVSVTVQEGMKRLFDPTTRHFTAWINNGFNQSHFREIPRLPLHVAAHYGLCDIAEFLVVQRAQNVNARQSDNRTPLSIASERGNGTITEFLLQHGADTNLRNNKSCIPLNLALERGHLEVVQILLDHRADANALDDNARTALHLVLNPYWYALCHSRFQSR
jgi:Ankyrin repeats (many copies)